MKLVNLFKQKLSDRRYQTAVLSTGMVAASVFPSFAAEGDLAAFTGTLTTLAAWLWKEVGLFCTFVLSQPMLMLALSIPFVGVIVNFFLRIFKSV